MQYSLVREYRKASEVGLTESALVEGSTYKHRKESLIALEGFLNAKAFVQILKKIAGPVTRESFQKTANQMKAIDLGVSEKGDFKNGSHQALHQVYFTTVINGETKTVTDWNFLK